MFVVHVTFKVKPEHRDAFLSATLEDAVVSRQEPGIAAFHVLERENEPGTFVLAEFFKSRDDGLNHLATDHFKAWQARIKPMLEAPPQALSHNCL